MDLVAMRRGYLGVGWNNQQLLPSSSLTELCRPDHFGSKRIASDIELPDRKAFYGGSHGLPHISAVL